MAVQNEALFRKPIEIVNTINGIVQKRYITRRAGSREVVKKAGNEK